MYDGLYKSLGQKNKLKFYLPADLADLHRLDIKKAPPARRCFKYLLIDLKGLKPLHQFFCFLLYIHRCH